MDNFIVSARKYRPASFDMVIGQESITRTLKNAIKNNKLAHAYLFCGPRGVGKTTCARIFAKTINCNNLDENMEACDTCESCTSFNTLRSFNIHELDAASNNKVEDIRSLNEQVRIPPQVGKYSIYIIDEVHMLSSSAFNAFLKTLEEPPAHAIFILATTEKHKIIPTILSRCQIFDFNRIRIEDIVNRLGYVAKQEEIATEEEALHIIAQKADGAMRDALSIFDQLASINGKSVAYSDVIANLNVLDFEYYFRIVDGALLSDISSVLMTFNEVLEKGFDGNNFIGGLTSHLRDLLVCKDEVTLRLLEATQAVKQRYLQQSARCSTNFIFKALEIGNNCELTIKNSRNPRLNVELALLKMCNIMASFQEAEKKKPEQSVSTREIKPESVSSGEKKPESGPSVEKTPGPPAIVEKTTVIHKERPSMLSNGTPARHTPVVEKPSKSFSIKDILSGGREGSENAKLIKDTEPVPSESAIEFTHAAFDELWKNFVQNITGDGPRIVSMFNAMTYDIDEKTIRIHLSNADQNDIFTLNYKQRLLTLLKEQFITGDLNIETFIEETEAGNSLYTDSQKAEYLINKYPAVAEMKKIFNLDIP